MAGTRLAFEHCADLAGRNGGGGWSLRIHLLNTGREDVRNPQRAEHVQIFIHGARILLKILVGTELGGIHKDGDDAHIRQFRGALNVGKMPLMQGAQSGRQCNSAACGALMRHHIAHTRDGLNNLRAGV